MRIACCPWSLSALFAALAVSGCGEARTPDPNSAPQPAQARPQSPPAPTPAPSPDDDAPRFEVAVYALSRGQGVPEAVRAACDAARAELQRMRSDGRALAFEETRIGIEGERRLCARFPTREEAERAAERLRALGKGVELFNVVVEPCARPGARNPSPGEQP